MSWMNTDATNKCKCPHCYAEPGERCKEPSGRLRMQPHGERLSELCARADFKAEAYQILKKRGEI